MDKLNLKVGLIRVLTTEDRDFLDKHGKILQELFPNLQIESRCIPDQPEGIHDDETEKLALPKILSLAKEFEERGKDAVFISCAADPGVIEARKSLRIPVIGAGSSCASVALSLGNKIGVLGITETAPAIMVEILGKRLVKSVKPKEVDTTLDLNTSQGKKNALIAAKDLKDSGCDVIALGCTGMTTIDIGKDIEEQVGIKVVDAVKAAGLILEYLTL